MGNKTLPSQNCTDTFSGLGMLAQLKILEVISMTSGALFIEQRAKDKKSEMR